MKVVVIGGGPAGVEAAWNARCLGHDVTLITKNKVGEWKSALPNLWLHHVQAIAEQKSFLLPELTNKREQWQQSLHDQLKEVCVQILEGKATFASSNTVEVITHNDEKSFIQADKFIIASGSRPVFPEAIQPDGKRIFSFENLPKLSEIPKSVIVIGESPIGYEMVHLFQQLECKVTWLLPVEKPSLDEDIITFYQSFFTKKGVELIRGPFIEKLINTSDQVVAIRKDGEQFNADYAFITLGFVPNIDQLALHKANVQVHKNGRVNVNEYYQTENPNIYVVGDAEQPHSAVFAKTSAYIATHHACNEAVDEVDRQLIPLSFNENPQVATVGQVNSNDSNGYAITIPYRAMNFRAYMTNKQEGFLKLVFNDLGIIIGGTCIGEEAKNIISVVALMIQLNVKANDVGSFFSSHPSALELPFTLIRNYLFELKK